jgi:hypothetical protein
MFFFRLCFESREDYGLFGECDTRMLVNVGPGSRIIQFDDFSSCNWLSSTIRVVDILALHFDCCERLTPESIWVATQSES